MKFTLADFRFNTKGNFDRTFENKNLFDKEKEKFPFKKTS